MHTKGPEVASDLDFALAAVAQGVINIDSGITSIERDSRVYEGMALICKLSATLAAAPEMLEALKARCHWCVMGWPLVDDSRHTPDSPMNTSLPCALRPVERTLIARIES